MASKTYLLYALNEISYDSLNEWRYNNLSSFSIHKKLFGYQQEGLKNAIIALYLYYSKTNIDKHTLYDRCLSKGMKEHIFDIKEKDKSYELFTSKNYFTISKYNGDNIIRDFNFFNRLCFWMATASGKTLMMIKLLEILDLYKKNNLIPNNDFLILLPDENGIEQFEKAINEYNVGKTKRIRVESLKNYDEIRNHLSFLDEIIVYTYRANLLSDQEKEKKVDVGIYDNDGKWYVLMDEAHKGSKNSGNESTIQSYVKIISRNGFLFNFSATFTEEIDYVTTCYNFNLEKFIENGYGKNIYLSESTFNFNKKEDDLSKAQKQIELFKSLIMLAIIKDEKKEGFYHNPIMVTLVDSVQEDNSDVDLFFKELLNVATNNINEKNFEKAKQELQAEFKDEKAYILGNDKLNLKTNNRFKTITIKKILKSVFNANSFGNIEIIEGEKGKELSLKLQTSDTPFALVRIGDTDEYIRTKIKGKFEINKNPVLEKSYFSLINTSEGQDFNIIIGSRMFYEGWDSNRPNIINYINIGVKDAKKYVLQSIGRGVRIQPFETDISNRKRMDFCKDKSQLLETLFVFATNKTAVANIIETMEEQSESGVTGRIIELKTNKRSFDLLIPKYDYFDKSINNISINSFKISKTSLNKLRLYCNALSNTLLLIRHNVNTIYIQKIRELINMDSSFMIDDEFDYKNIEDLFERIVNIAISEDCIVKKIDLLSDEIVHFKHIKVKNEYYDNISEKINECSLPKKDNSKVLKVLTEKFIGKKISEEEFINETAKLKNKSETTFLDLRFNSLLEHYYMPIIMSSEDKIDYINHIITVPSEVNFVSNLIDYLKTVSHKINYEWMFCKIDQSIDYGMGMPYSDQFNVNLSYFYPDFVFWQKKNNKYIITFVDPKGKMSADYQLKIDGFVKLFYKNDKPKIFKYKDYEVEVHLMLVNDNLSGIGERYIKFWHNNYTFDDWL